MKVVSLSIEDGAHDGLVAGEMTRLGDVVVLAGPNGGGKSRLLQRVLAIGDPFADLAARNLGLQAKRFAAAGDGRRAEEYEARARSEALESVRRAGARIDELSGSVHAYCPRSGDLTAYRASRYDTVQKQAGAVVESIGVSTMQAACIPYIIQVQDRWVSARDQESAMSAEQREEALTSYVALRHMIEGLLSERLSYDQDRNPTLAGQSVVDFGLSDGQKVLLQLAVALHAQGQRLNGLILVLDEPELHLHPAVVVGVLDRLREVNPAGQLWIATHALPVLAWAPQESLWFVNEGRARWAGRQPELVLDGLLGDTAGRARLETFLQLPAQLAMVRFAGECLIPPRAVMTDTEDVQLQQIRDALHASVPGVGPLRVLDYGAGKARLLPAIAAAVETGDLREFVDYRAFDPFPEDLEYRKQQIAEYYGADDGEQRCFDTPEELAKLDRGSVDVVVLCNVLHEIEPVKWVTELGPDSVIAQLLRADGFLLIVEDYHIPVGEKAHQHGFILLDNVHLHQLFGCSEASAQIMTTRLRDGRLAAHLVPASLLNGLTRETTVAAIKLLQTTAKRRIRALREASPTFRNGQLHALWTQLFANTHLALEALG